MSTLASGARLLSRPSSVCLASVFLLAVWGMAIRAGAPPAACGSPPCPPSVPEKPPRPLTGPESIAAFIEGLSSNDSAFEVILGQGRILTLKANLAAAGKPPALVAVGDPSVADFSVLNSRQIRIIGQRIGLTDLSISTPDGKTYGFDVRVVADLPVLRGQLHCLFPDASLRLWQVRDHVVVEGEARDAVQVARILETIRAYLVSVQASQLRRVSGQTAPAGRPVMPPTAVPPGEPEQPAAASPEQGGRSVQGTTVEPRIINLLKVPGSKQVLLKVRVAELNRTAMRQIGADFLAVDPDSGAIVGTQIGGALVTGVATAANRMLKGVATSAVSPSTTAFGIFEKGNFAVLLSALRRNALLKVLAEPNLVALTGQTASFLAGGEFPVPVSQSSSGGAAPTVTVQFQPFGVKLDFLPTILDGDVIRLSVDPEVSSVDFSLGTVLVPGGTPVPGLNTRKVHTVVEMREGQTLAIAGLLQVTLDGTTNRIPGLGDLPILGPFFSNTTENRMEKELIVLVTPYLVEPMRAGEVPPTPGDEVNAPTDLEFYLGNRLEGRTGTDWRATTMYDLPLPRLRCMFRLEDEFVHGPHGFGE